MLPALAALGITESGNHGKISKIIRPNLQMNIPTIWPTGPYQQVLLSHL